MTKKIILGLTVGLMLALSIATGSIGCGGSSNNGGSGGGGGGGTAGGGGGGGGGTTDVDMGFVCVASPMTGDELLNGCAPATVDKVEISPFYPTLAPGGVLPALQ
ncbi:MAG: hypothetical protein JWM53_5582 [bacterium]|nr:hypothetical protein [bacterium]